MNAGWLEGRKLQGITTIYKVTQTNKALRWVLDSDVIGRRVSAQIRADLSQ